MIEVCIKKNAEGLVIGFTVKNHGSSYVCAAVSVLTINTINAIEHFVQELMELSIDEDGAYISCSFPNVEKGIVNSEADLLLKTMVFGLKNIMLEHPQDICVKEVSE